jgi:hypothetical protein
MLILFNGFGMQNDTFSEEQRQQFLGNKELKKIFRRMKQK